MKQTRLIPLYRTFTNWIIIVAIGSAFLPFVSLFLGGNSTFSSRRTFDDDTWGLALLSMIVSALCSLPALIVMFFTHLILNRKTTVLRNHQLIQNCVHLVVSLITFGVMGAEMGTNDSDFLTAIIISYVSVGLIVWNITYLIYKRKKTFEADKVDVLD